MRIYNHKVSNSVPAVYDLYWNGKLISSNVWVVMDD